MLCVKTVSLTICQDEIVSHSHVFSFPFTSIFTCLIHIGIKIFAKKNFGSDVNSY